MHEAYVSAIPVGVGIVNPNVCRLGRRRGVGVGVGAVCARHDETHGSRQSVEQTHARLVDARGIRLSEAELWSGTLGSITAHASFTSATHRLNVVIPMGTKHRGAMWGRTRCTKNVLLLVSVELK
jgi:hypothetical protein